MLEVTAWRIQSEINDIDCMQDKEDIYGLYPKFDVYWLYLPKSVGGKGQRLLFKKQ